ncbi:MAG: biotin/lipoyl-containing protein [Bacteriovoracaceae bacterium]
MRYYFVGEEELVFDIKKTVRKSSNLYQFHVLSQKDSVEKVMTVRKLAGKLYYSDNGVSWKKIAEMRSPHTVLHTNQHLTLFRGFKPSTFSTGEAGDLVTQMPGKVVKIIGSLGQKVNQGDTLVIIEAMKMENEIKAGTTGIIKSIHIKEGQALEAGFTMMEIEVEPT